MALKPTIRLHQKPHLAATRKMQLSLQILGMSNLQLDTFLQAEQAENPLLEVVSTDLPTTYSGTGISATTITEETVAARESLIAAVVRQLALITASESDPRIALVLSENLNGKGYLDQSLEEISNSTGYPVERLKIGLELLQSLEPSGVGARSAVECIELQLRAKNIWDKDHALVLNNLNAIETDLTAFALNFGFSTSKLSGILDTIRSQPLDLSDSFSDPLVHHVIPDVLFTFLPNGTIRPALNESAFPRLRTDSAYLDGSLSTSDDVETYLNCQIKRIGWLSRALEKRSATILSIAVTLVRLQKGYFDNGPRGMKPLTMKAVAGELKISVSTVSRAVSGKFALCSEGTVPMRYFFPSAVSKSESESHSATMIRSHISQIIDQEGRSNIATDTKIADLLSARGITVARRTIAKYRECMNIPKSSIRRVQKRNRLRP